MRRLVSVVEVMIDERALCCEFDGRGVDLLTVQLQSVMVPCRCRGGGVEVSGQEEKLSSRLLTATPPPS